MLSTEAEAGVKQCCVTGCGRMGIFNKGKRTERHVKVCIGSACMAWRWTDLRPGGVDNYCPDPDAPLRGFCGRAGPPDAGFKE